MNQKTHTYELIKKQARCLSKSEKENDFVRFQWLADDDDYDKYYFEMRIQVDEITKDVSLIVSDFANEDELEDSKMFWENQISNLKQVLGSA